MNSIYDIFQEITVGAEQAFRFVVPEPHNRQPLTWSIAPLILASYIPFTFLAYLARRPDTYLIRLLLFPTVLAATLTATYRYYWTIPALNVYNWGQSLAAGVMIAKTLEYTFTPEGMLKNGESKPGQLKGKASAANGHAVVPVTRTGHLAWFVDAVELQHTLRGLQWKFGRGVYIPEHIRPLSRTPFLKETLKSFIKYFLLLDVLETCIKLFPGVGTPAGGSIFYPDLPLMQRYAVSTLIHMLTGSALLAGFHMVYDLITLIAVGVFNDTPTAWPPVMDQPFTSSSMHELWAKRWHQLLRRTFVVYGGVPGKWLAGDLGAVFGTFLASGLYHECAIYTMGRGFDHTVTVFFALQGPILVGERMWRRITGKRVGGRIGRYWVYLVMFVGAQPMINTWHVRGLGGGMVIPPFISPARLLVDILLAVIRANKNDASHFDNSTIITDEI